MVTKTKRKPTGAAAMGAGPGRPKGVPNKATAEFKEAVTRLLDYAAPEMVGWLSRVAEENPEKALDLTAKLAEYAAPKLARTEVTGEGGGPQKHVISWES
jgi:hypothetical protein